MRQWQVIALASGLTLAAHGWLLWGERHASGGQPNIRQAVGATPPSMKPLRWVLLPPLEVAQAMGPGTPVGAAVGAPAAPSRAPQPGPPGADLPHASASPPPPGKVPGPAMAEGQVHHWRSSDLDFRAWPMSPPDARALDGLAWTTEAPVRLRLTISATGEVEDVAGLGPEALPDDVLQALAAMFKATPFMPARRLGQDVASVQDIEIQPEQTAQVQRESVAPGHGGNQDAALGTSAQSTGRDSQRR